MLRVIVRAAVHQARSSERPGLVRNSLLRWDCSRWAYAPAVMSTSEMHTDLMHALNRSVKSLLKGMIFYFYCISIKKCCPQACLLCVLSKGMHHLFFFFGVLHMMSLPHVHSSCTLCLVGLTASSQCTHIVGLVCEVSIYQEFLNTW